MGGTGGIDKVRVSRGLLEVIRGYTPHIQVLISEFLGVLFTICDYGYTLEINRIKIIFYIGAQTFTSSIHFYKT